MTPAIDVAREAGIEHQLHQYQHHPASAGYGAEAAEKLGLNPACVFKTLVVAVDAKTWVVAIVPVNAMLSMKLIAKAANGKKPSWQTSSKCSAAAVMFWEGLARWGKNGRLRRSLTSQRSCSNGFTSAPVGEGLKLSWRRKTWPRSPWGALSRCA